MKTVLALLIGLPGAGKSTLAQALKQHNLNSESFHTIVVSFDAIIPIQKQSEIVHLKSEGEWKRVRKNIFMIIKHILTSSESPIIFCDETEISVKNLLNEFLVQVYPEVRTNANKKTVLIVIDDNMYYQSMRYLYYQLARTHNAGFCQIYIDCSIDLAEERNSKRVYSLPFKIIKNMAEKIEPPSSKNSWEENSITITVSDLDINLNSVMKLIEFSASNPIPPLVDDSLEREASKEICASNVIHKIDQILRKLVSKHVKLVSPSSESTKAPSVASEIGQKRKCILSDIKSGRILIPKECREELELNGISDKLTIYLTDFLELLLVC